MDDIIQYIDKEYNDCTNVSINYSKAKRTKEKITKLKSVGIPDYKKSLDDLKIISKKSPESIIDDTESDMKELRKKIKETEDALNKLKTYGDEIGLKLSSLSINKINSDIEEIKLNNPNFKNYYSIGGIDLWKEIESIKIGINSKNESLLRNISQVEIYQDKLNELLKKEPHKYQENYDNGEIQKLAELVKNLSLSLKSYGDYLTDMRKKNKPESKRTVSHDGNPKVTWEISPYENYCKMISRYFALKIKQFNFTSDVFNPKYVNIVTEEIILDNGKSIKFDDISTGQGISLYLQTLVNRSATDSRKIIALFDEVSTMDKRSLDPILEILRKLNESGKLMLAIFVKMDEIYEVYNLE
ncbi:hypothetical protein MsAg5_16250 [Methanosarcinaceae archaeon Ag5]|uniref:Uncharacterized protein n=1 Tax=Methanolapillus africanus TaxID=3028297 RepID=A0AAE4SEK1_9EURY|nr:hypothetical protein [Methanosarcinaceae archaeon Ag5]